MTFIILQTIQQTIKHCNKINWQKEVQLYLYSCKLLSELKPKHHSVPVLFIQTLQSCLRDLEISNYLLINMLTVV